MRRENSITMAPSRSYITTNSSKQEATHREHEDHDSSEFFTVYKCDQVRLIFAILIIIARKTLHSLIEAYNGRYMR